MLLTWAISLIVEDASIVGIAWVLGFVLVAWTFTLGLDDRPARSIPLVALTFLWGIAGYVAWRDLGEPEDRRHRARRLGYVSHIERNNTFFPGSPRAEGRA